MEKKTKKKNKKERKSSIIKRLHNQASRLWKEIAFLRDGHECQVLKTYPFIQVAHTPILQVDHTFTRANKHLFYEPANSLVVCSCCNALKHYHLKSVERAIDDIVRTREGDVKFAQMKEIDFHASPNTDFNNILWLEEQIKSLEAYKLNLAQSLEIYTNESALATT